jgi:hypothetical protein
MPGVPEWCAGRSCQRPQPAERSEWIEGIAVYGVPSITRRTPDWERLPPLDVPDQDPAEPQDEVEPDLSGRPLPALAVAKAMELYEKVPPASIRAVAAETALSRTQARRVKTWVDSGAVWFDRRRWRIRVASGYELEEGGTDEEPTLQLIRV